MRKRTLHILPVIVLLFLFASEAGAQKFLNEGNRYFDRNLFEEAIPFYLKELEKGKSFKVKNEAMEKLANCYRLTGRFLEANEMYKKILDKSGWFDKSEHVLNYAKSLKNSALYAEAAEQFEKYIKLKPDDPMGKIYLESCHLAQEWLDEPEEYFVMNFDGINSPESEFAPAYFENGMVFTSSREGSIKRFISLSPYDKELATDLYYTNLLKSREEKFIPENIEGLNTYLHEGAATFSSDFNKVFFTRTIMGEKNRKKNQVLNSLQVYFSERDREGNWKEPKSAFSFNSEKYSIGQPSLSPDGKTICFISDMPGGMGKTDIYYSKLKPDGKWGEPVNLGKDINTFGHELFPYIHSNDTLYFSSDTHPGMGALDIFRAVRTEDGWQVENMKTPVNSIGDDFGIVFNREQTRGLFSSDRFNGKGKEDIYTVYHDEELEISFDGNNIRIPDKSIYSGITYKISKEGSDNSQALLSEEGMFTCRLEEDSLYRLTLRKNGFFYDAVDLKISHDTENIFTAEIISRSSQMKIKGTIALEETKIVKHELKEKKKTKLVADTIIKSRTVAGAPVLLMQNEKQLERILTGDKGNFAFSPLLSGNVSYKILAFEPEAEPPAEQESVIAEEKQKTAQEEEKEEPAEEILPPEKEILTTMAAESETMPEESLPEEKLHEKDTTLAGFVPEEITSKEQPEKIKQQEVKQEKPTQPEFIKVSGEIFSKNDKQNLSGGQLKIYSGNELLAGELIGREGKFSLKIPERKEYTISMTQKGYFQQQLRMDQSELRSRAENLEIPLSPIQTDKVIKIDNIFFDFNQYNIKAESLIELERVAEFLKVNPDIKIELNAHTDTRGKYFFNLHLSYQRAKAVKNYLVNHGIESGRIIENGFGESFPAIPGATTEKEHEKNRRVEFRVIDDKSVSRYAGLDLPVDPKGFMILDKCPYSAANPIPEDSPLPEGLFYRIKIGEFSRTISYNTFRGLFPLSCGTDGVNHTREYFAGLFYTLEDAEIALHIIRTNFSKDAYIRAYYNNHDITIEKALSIASGKDQNLPAKVVPENIHQNVSRPYFAIQIGAFRRTVRSSAIEDFRKISGTHELISFRNKGNMVYAVGLFESYEEAFAAKQTIVNRYDIRDAFIIGYYNNQKIPISEANHIIKKLRREGKILQANNE